MLSQFFLKLSHNKKNKKKINSVSSEIIGSPREEEEEEEEKKETEKEENLFLNLESSLESHLNDNDEGPDGLTPFDRINSYGLKPRMMTIRDLLPHTKPQHQIIIQADEQGVFRSPDGKRILFQSPEGKLQSLSKKNLHCSSDNVGPSCSSSSMSVAVTPRGFEKYHLIKVLHHVQDRVIYLARYYDEQLEDHVEVVIKRQPIISPRYICNRPTQSIHELAVHQSLTDPSLSFHKGYPFIVKYLDHFLDSNTNGHYLVMEYCHQGTLLDLIRSLKTSIPLPHLNQFIYDLLNAVEFMHSIGYVHRDIKCENIFITYDERLKRMVLKLGDFGFSMMASNTCKDHDIVGSLHYMSPEIIMASLHRDFEKGKNPFASDAWACGIVIYCMIEWHFPFGFRDADLNPELDLENSIEIVKNDIITYNIRQRRKYVRVDIYELLLDGLLETNPEKRFSIKISLDQLLFHTTCDKKLAPIGVNLETMNSWKLMKSFC